MTFLVVLRVSLVSRRRKSKIEYLFSGGSNFLPRKEMPSLLTKLPTFLGRASSASSSPSSSSRKRVFFQDTSIRGNHLKWVGEAMRYQQWSTLWTVFLSGRSFKIVTSIFIYPTMRRNPFAGDSNARAIAPVTVGRIIPARESHRMNFGSGVSFRDLNQ